MQYLRGVIIDEEVRQRPQRDRGCEQMVHRVTARCINRPHNRKRLCRRAGECSGQRIMRARRGIDGTGQFDLPNVDRARLLIEGLRCSQRKRAVAHADRARARRRGRRVCGEAHGDVVTAVGPAFHRKDRMIE